LPTNYQAAEEALDELAEDWKRLLGETSCRWPFLQPTWLQVWWSEFPISGKLLLLGVRDGERLVGVAPLIHDANRLSFAGDASICDYMDIIAARGREPEVLDSVLRYAEALTWCRFELWGIRADSPTLPALRSLADRYGLHLDVEPEAVCPRVSLPATWDDYLTSLGKKDRHELRRKLRRFFEASHDSRHYVLSTVEDIRDGLDDFFRLHRISRQDKAEFMTPQMEHFFRVMAESLAKEDLLRLFYLEVDGRRVASVFAFDCGNELWLYNSGYDPMFASVSVGLVSKAIVLREAIEEGKRCYDLLRGRESYKYDLGARDLEVVRCTLSRGCQDSEG
jgi:CelD/BcsL family acetyltransferase involved in cellulose biosynthesis